MATQYPTTYPVPQIDSFSMIVQMGVARSEMGGQQMQRRVFQSMPTMFSLTFVMSLSNWTLWQRWVKLNAYTWFTMRLPNLYASQQDLLTDNTLIRFVSPLQASNVTDALVQVSVQAEMAPSEINNYLAVA
jgi:hypothetical protein